MRGQTAKAFHTTCYRPDARAWRVHPPHLLGPPVRVLGEWTVYGIVERHDCDARDNNGGAVSYDPPYSAAVDCFQVGGVDAGPMR